MGRKPFSGTFARNPKPVAQDEAGAQKEAGSAPKPVQAAGGSSDINTALERLGQSVAHLRNAVDYRLKLDENQGELRAEFNRMNDERKRLAARLDQAEGRGQAMQQVNQDVSQRLAAAMETIRTILENQAR